MWRTEHKRLDFSYSSGQDDMDVGMKSWRCGFRRGTKAGRFSYTLVLILLITIKTQASISIVAHQQQKPIADEISSTRNRIPNNLRKSVDAQVRPVAEEVPMRQLEEETHLPSEALSSLLPETEMETSSLPQTSSPSPAGFSVTELDTLAPTGTSATAGSPTIKPTIIPSDMPAADNTIVLTQTFGPSGMPAADTGSTIVPTKSSKPAGSPELEPTSYPTGTSSPVRFPTGTSMPVASSVTSAPTDMPSVDSTVVPTQTSGPAGVPGGDSTLVPTHSSAPSSTEADPTFYPTGTSAPMGVPTETSTPVTSSVAPTRAGNSTAFPTQTSVPSGVSTADRTVEPTKSSAPAGSPEAGPTLHPTGTSMPAGFPELDLTLVPTMPSPAPSILPTGTRQPSLTPSVVPSYAPSIKPSEDPSMSPSVEPSLVPSAIPSDIPSLSTKPTSVPSDRPSSSHAPSKIPSEAPSVSKIPSTSPSETPSISLFPSAMPSDQPSLSMIPSSLPSEMPSESQVPSEAPSRSHAPSAIPSGKPSISQAPSMGPSASPTLSIQPSHEPSVSAEPSVSPSISPSDLPSIRPSYSVEPSSMPSLQPSSLPSIAPSESHMPTTSQSPSISPSTMPSFEPSAIPSVSPSNVPSMMPSVSPSVLPSSSPSDSPSDIPSSEPSDTPSLLPSSTPSAMPSLLPSSMPTFECHDNAFYTSPINDLSCEKFKDTECTDWRFIGLDLNQLAELVENCPVTCDIDCGTFSLLDSPFSFILSYVEEQIGSNAQQELEETAKKYFEEFVQERIQDFSTFALDEASLTSTKILVNRRLVSGSQRVLMGFAQLRINLMLSGFAININMTDVMHLLTEAVDSPGFTTELRRSDPFFSTANASTVPPAIPANLLDTGSDDKRNSKSTATITVSALIGVTCFALAVGWLVYHGRRTHGCRLLGIRSKQLPPLSPGLASPRDSSIFEFDGSPNASAQTTPHTSNGILRMLSLSRSRSRSTNNTTSSCSSGNQSQSFHSALGDDDDLEDDEVDDGTKQDEEAIPEHPLSGIIPPMIVIDIEDDPEAKSTGSNHSEKKSVGSGVPMKHVEASSALMAALSTPNHPSMSLSEMLYHREGERMGTTPRSAYACRSKRSIESSGFFSGDSDGDDSDSSIASTPVKYSESDVELGLRRTLSSSALDIIEPSEALDELIRSQWDELGLSPSPSKSTSLPASPEESQPRAPLDFTTPLATSGITMTPTRHSFAEATTVRRGTHRVIRSGDAMEGMTLVGDFTPVFSNLSPIHKSSPKKQQPSTITLPQLDFVGNSPNRAKPRAGSLSSTTMDEGGSITNNSRSSSKGSLSQKTRAKAGKQEARLSFEVPSSGKLGLIIESSSNRGPTVHTVKDYSPLYGLLAAGDRILRVDGEDTKSMSTGQVTRLLARSKSSNDNGMTRIIVSRPPQTPPLPILVDSVETSPPIINQRRKKPKEEAKTVVEWEPPKQEEFDAASLWETTKQEQQDSLVLSQSFEAKYRSVTITDKPSEVHEANEEDEEEGGNSFHLLGANNSMDDDEYDDFF